MFLPGVGELIALELLFVTGGESKAQLGEVTDARAQHLIRFEPQNPHTSKEKTLVIKNCTYVAAHLSYSAPSSWRNLHAPDKLFAESLLLFAPYCLVIKVQGMLNIVQALWQPLAKVKIFASIGVKLQKIHKYTWLQEYIYIFTG